MIRRLFVDAPLTTGQRRLPDERAHYLKNVLRVRDGEALLVFDGQGTQCPARVQLIGRGVELCLEVPQPSAVRPGPRAHLAFAVLKGRAADQVVRKATELDVTDLWPLYTDHTDLPRARLDQSLFARWRSIVVSAAEQCGQNHLPTLHAPLSLPALLQQRPVAQLLLMDRSGEPWPLVLPPVESMLLSGPEGGWSAAELELAGAAGVPVVALGRLVLRAETAPVVALTALQRAWLAAEPAAGAR